MQNPFARAARDSVRLTARTVAVTLTAFLIASCGGEGFDEAPTPSLYSTTVVIGASLTDTGNVCPTAATPGCPPVPPYASGRFSNGTLFVETIAGRYGAAVAPSTRGGTNFARAGARTGAIPGLATQSPTPSMVAQLNEFILSPVAANALRPQTLFVVDASTFGNNITAGLPLLSSPTPPITSAQLVGAAVTDVVTILTRLYAAGARQILVVNAPNVGLTPVARALGAQAAGAATQLSAGFNGALAQQMGILAANSPGLTMYTLDLFALISDGAGLTAAGITNQTDACVTTTSLCSTPDSYLFWDGFHPTRAAGALVAARAATVLPAP